MLNLEFFLCFNAYIIKIISTLTIGLLGGSNACFKTSEYFCPECAQYFCNDCNTLIHKHPKQSNHTPSEIADTSSVSMTYSTDDEYKVLLSMQNSLLHLQRNLSSHHSNHSKRRSSKPLWMVKIH